MPTGCGLAIGAVPQNSDAQAILNSYEKITLLASLNY
jgi:hypothetical protein